VQDSLPTIWFTINPNDITNPVKIDLAVYGSSILKAKVEQFLNEMLESTTLKANKQIKALADPVSAVLFF
jgi:hypothetical protein